MRTLWVVTLGLVALAATQGCKRRGPEPIPGPKAVSVAVGHARAPGIAWFQGGLDEAFTRTPRICSTEPRAVAPPAPDLARMRNRANSPPAPAACRAEPCPPVAYPRRPLV
jgi:hypothetical protein